MGRSTSESGKLLSVVGDGAMAPVVDETE